MIDLLAYAGGMWYNIGMNELPGLSETMTVEPYTGQGGKRPGAGRPPSLVKQTKKAEALARQLQAAVKLGMSPLLDSYPELIKTAIERAKAGDNKLLMFLIALPVKMANLDEFREDSLGDSILREALTGRTVNIQINNGDTARVGRVLDGDFVSVGDRPDARAGEDS